IFGVCHVLRYTPYTRRLRELLSSGAVGDPVSVEHLEPVGWWHHAHSYVRGSWSKTAESGPMLLAKGCHDIDWLQYVMGDRIAQVSSFGRNTHFVPANAPTGATEGCLDCPLNQQCAYSATRIYLDEYRDGDPLTWPRDVLTSKPTRLALEEALARGPYGRCVYGGGNDVVDHQVVALEFVGGATGTFTMTAFTPKEDRKTRIFGTQGYLDGDGHTIRHVDFRTGRERHYSVNAPGPMDAGGGHAGGDAGLMDAFVGAVASGDQSVLSSDAGESLSSHVAVFAAERARQLRTVEQVS
ncbi:MAG TPA: Gfo/Idh/MocA family oxidoreductase, partial [Arachnia sp.]|nr:Gfo/Idh/MocA family oxidoreductase [Arachnia sp.]